MSRPFSIYVPTSFHHVSFNLRSLNLAFSGVFYGSSTLFPLASVLLAAWFFCFYLASHSGPFGSFSRFTPAPLARQLWDSPPFPSLSFPSCDLRRFSALVSLKCAAFFFFFLLFRNAGLPGLISLPTMKISTLLRSFHVASSLRGPSLLFPFCVYHAYRLFRLGLFFRGGFFPLAGAPHFYALPFPFIFPSSPVMGEENVSLISAHFSPPAKPSQPPVLLWSRRFTRRHHPFPAPLETDGSILFRPQTRVSAKQACLFPSSFFCEFVVSERFIDPIYPPPYLFFAQSPTPITAGFCFDFFQLGSPFFFIRVLF